MLHIMLWIIVGSWIVSIVANLAVRFIYRKEFAALREATRGQEFIFRGQKVRF